MSAWNVLSSLGIFPVQPGHDAWGLSTPVFARVDLRLDRRHHPCGPLRVTAPGTSEGRPYVQSARVDGTPYGPHLSDDGRTAKDAVARLHGRHRAVGLGHGRPGRAACVALTHGSARIPVTFGTAGIRRRIRMALLTRDRTSEQALR